VGGSSRRRVGRESMGNRRVYDGRGLRTIKSGQEKSADRGF
jgi:hypothetical protein